MKLSSSYINSIWRLSIEKVLITNHHIVYNPSFKLYLPTDLTASLDSNLSLSQKQQLFDGYKLDFKNYCAAGGSGGNSTTSTSATGGSLNSITQSLCVNQASSSPTDISQQFNIFPAIFSRQLNFTAASAGGGGTCGTQTGKLMDDLRPNLVGGLLGLQQGLLDDHALAHGNLQHGGHQDAKFMSLQDNRLMGIASHENRLLGLSQDLRSALASGNHLDNGGVGKNTGLHQNRKCSSTPEDFSALYGGLTAAGLGDASHHHTPSHTPPSSRLNDHTITGEE